MHAIAPAKINLNLHITGRHDDGYHTLQSLTAFTALGDNITLRRALDTGFEVAGVFAPHFKDHEISAAQDSDNLMIKALYAACNHFNIEKSYHITLQKNLPLASGIGGGTSDAATLVQLLLDDQNKEMDNALMQKLTALIGADFPVCYYARSCVMGGIGDVITPIPLPHNIPVLLVNCGAHVSTREIFESLGRDYTPPQEWPKSFETQDELVSFLKETQNDLYLPAKIASPEIEISIQKIIAEGGCQFTAMSGSGATCFGIFETDDAAQNAAQNILFHAPSYWAQTTRLNESAQ